MCKHIFILYTHAHTHTHIHSYTHTHTQHIPAHIDTRTHENISMRTLIYTINFILKNIY